MEGGREFALLDWELNPSTKSKPAPVEIEEEP